MLVNAFLPHRLPSLPRPLDAVFQSGSENFHTGRIVVSPTPPYSTLVEGLAKLERAGDGALMFEFSLVGDGANASQHGCGCGHAEAEALWLNLASVG